MMEDPPESQHPDSTEDRMPPGSDRIAPQSKRRFVRTLTIASALVGSPLVFAGLYLLTVTGAPLNRVAIGWGLFGFGWVAAILLLVPALRETQPSGEEPIVYPLGEQARNLLMAALVYMQVAALRHEAGQSWVGYHSVMALVFLVASVTWCLIIVVRRCGAWNSCAGWLEKSWVALVVWIFSVFVFAIAVVNNISEIAEHEVPGWLTNLSFVAAIILLLVAFFLDRFWHRLVELKRRLWDVETRVP